MSGDRETITIEQRVANQSDLDALTCAICLSLMTSPIKQCVSGHLGCGSCLEKVSTCPQCRVSISNGGLSRSLITDHMLSHLRVNNQIVLIKGLYSPIIHCVNYFKYNQDSKKWVKDARGCQEIVTVATSDDHELTCKYNLLKCQHQGCNEEVLKDDMTSHLAQCKHQPKEKISCPFGTDICKFIGTKKEVDQHILNSISDHIESNNQKMDDKIKALEKKFSESMESIKKSNTEYVDQKIKKNKEKTKIYINQLGND
ncbi:hypothetical protein DFA_01904 [Cavenderia fasciculata]|uniref:RING-type domain-containing protein n=1 Tax=Cavenderia fasciculata TaxID=261658 RepID=F4PQQ7_CACFS|nr:uncharacterized protein DFA_01904 [Cavenderia fasciculata]EGG22015.1 hypothetical protein DFA_01904 [Cavenderia fasciculata]|eukprot:XP_004359866.1 hypothetical protein DFA_01904 [Cavenderia fasciculata]